MAEVGRIAFASHHLTLKFPEGTKKIRCWKIPPELSDKEGAMVGTCFWLACCAWAVTRVFSRVSCYWSWFHSGLLSTKVIFYFNLRLPSQILRLTLCTPPCSFRSSALQAWLAHWQTGLITTGLKASSLQSFPGSSVDKESTCNAGDPGSSPGSGRSPGKGIGYPLQYSGLEKSIGSQTVRHDWATFTFSPIHSPIHISGLSLSHRKHHMQPCFPFLG